MMSDNTGLVTAGAVPVDDGILFFKEGIATQFLTITFYILQILERPRGSSLIFILRYGLE